MLYCTVCSPPRERTQLHPGATMGKAVRVTRRGSAVSGHSTSSYPYAPKRLPPRSKPLQRMCPLNPIHMELEARPL